MRGVRLEAEGDWRFLSKEGQSFQKIAGRHSGSGALQRGSLRCRVEDTKSGCRSAQTPVLSGNALAMIACHLARALRAWCVVECLVDPMPYRAIPFPKLKTGSHVKWVCAGRAITVEASTELPQELLPCSCADPDPNRAVAV